MTEATIYKLDFLTGRFEEIGQALEDYMAQSSKGEVKFFYDHGSLSLVAYLDEKAHDEATVSALQQQAQAFVAGYLKARRSRYFPCKCHRIELKQSPGCQHSPGKCPGVYKEDDWPEVCGVCSKAMGRLYIESVNT